MSPNKTFSRTALSLLLTLLAAVSSWGANEDIGSIKYNTTLKAYEIKSLNNLKDLAAYVTKGYYSTGPYNSTTHTCKGLKFVVTANIGSVGEITPIGSQEVPFEGSFDGGNYMISAINPNISVYTTSGQTTSGSTIYIYYIYRGLFGYLGSSADIKNLKVSVYAYTGGYEYNYVYMGGIAGYNKGWIHNCTSYFYTTNYSITGKAYMYLGGIAGYNSGTIDSAYVYNNVSLTVNGDYESRNFVGGIAGYNAYNIRRSTIGSNSISFDGSPKTATAGAGYNYVGGIAGYGFTVDSCLSSATINATGGRNAYVGGITGYSEKNLKVNFFNEGSVNVSDFKNSYVGAVSGSTSSSASKSSNYYYNVSINGESKGYGVGTTSGDVTGISAAYQLNLTSCYTTKNVEYIPTVTDGTKYVAYNRLVSFKAADNPQLCGSLDPGYTYALYNTNVAVTTISDSMFFYMPAHNVKIQKNGTTKIHYTITYELNGGELPEDAPTTYTVTDNVTLPTPSKPGYQPAGWFTTSSFTSSSQVSSIPKGSTGNKKYYAKWTGNTYYVSFNGNGGSCRMSNQTFTYGVSQKLTKASCTAPSGKGLGSFSRWTTLADGSGKKYTDEQSVSNLTTVNMTASSGMSTPLYAQYKKIIGSHKDITIDAIPNQIYTGNEIKPAVTVYDTSANITGNFEITYSDNIEIGQASVTITAKTSTYYYYYEGSVTRHFNIVAPKKDIATSADITISAIDDQTWTGSAIEPPVSVMDGVTDITSHCDITYSNNINAGIATVTITAKSTSTLYTGSATRTFNIIDMRKDIATSPDITISAIDDQTWTGSAIEPPVTVMDGVTDITSHCDITYSNNIDVGEATVTISANSNSALYKGSTTRTFNIIEVPFVLPVANELTYTGKAQELVTAGAINNGTVFYSLNDGDYSTDIPTAVNAGKYTVHYKMVKAGEDDQIGEIEVTIQKATPTITPPVANSLVYTGEKQELITAGKTDVGVLKYYYWWPTNASETEYYYFNENIPTGKNAGVYGIHYFVDETENYKKAEGYLNVDIPGAITKTGFAVINEVDGKKYVELNGEFNRDYPFYIGENFEAEKVEIVRTFPITEGKNYSTLMLPCEVSTSQLKGVANIVEFDKVGTNKETGLLQVEVNLVWADTSKEDANLSAYKPYMIQMKAPNLEIEGSVAMKTSRNARVTKGDWTFVGTADYTEWSESSSEYGRVFGFSGTSKEGIGVGQFVRFGKGSYFNPMRAYLLYNPPKRLNAPGRKFAAPIASIEEELPYRMDVVIVERESGEEHTTVIGTLDTRTGEFEMLRNYDLNGRKVNSTSKAHKAYYGKKVLKK